MKKSRIGMLSITLLLALTLASCAGTAAEALKEVPASDTQAPTEMQGTEEKPVETERVEPSILVSDQALMDGKVIIEKADAADPGWLVIHADQDGAPGPVIGFAPIARGVNLNTEVEIDSGRATPKLFAMLHLDAGMPGEYEFPGEDVPVKVGDAIVSVPFTLLESKSMSGEISIMVLDSRFDAKEVTVPVGTTIVWTSTASLPHNVIADDGLFASETMRDGDTFSFTFEKAGTYPYYCTFHGGPGGKGMAGTIIVTGP